MADKTQEAEELENWIDDTREKIFKVRWILASVDKSLMWVQSMTIDYDDLGQAGDSSEVMF